MGYKTLILTLEMCWNQTVSAVSFAYDAVCLAILWRRGDMKYVAMLSGVVAQEWCQFVVWRLLDRSERCRPLLAVASIAAMLASQAIPLGVADRVALGLWGAQLVVVFVCLFLSGQWCARVGQNHHQQWICAQSLYAVGGFPLYLASFALYAAAWVRGFRTLDLPRHEKLIFKRIAGLSAALVYAYYTVTLEACSVWCWSAAALCTYAVLRPTTS